jgi:uncharacterized membrane protein
VPFCSDPSIGFFDGWDRDFAALKAASAAPYSIENDSQLDQETAMLSDLVKSGTWAVVQMAIGFGVGTGVTGSAGYGLFIALFAGSVGSFAYWLHERLWKAHARR